MSDLTKEIPKTYQSPTMSPHCTDLEKYKIVDIMTQKFKEFFEKKTKITDKVISEILTINGVRFILENGSWGLIRASSNKPSLVVVTESIKSTDEMKAIFDFIDNLLKATGKVGKYDQKIQKEKYSKNNFKETIKRKTPNNLLIIFLFIL